MMRGAETALTWKESVIDRFDGSGDASIAASGTGYREGIEESAVRQRIEKGRFVSKSALVAVSLCLVIGTSRTA